jgi:hypothetical protein
MSALLNAQVYIPNSQPTFSVVRLKLTKLTNSTTAFKSVF